MLFSFDLLGWMTSLVMIGLIILGAGIQLISTKQSIRLSPDSLHYLKVTEFFQERKANCEIHSECVISSCADLDFLVEL
jgi:hypothetical protein